MAPFFLAYGLAKGAYIGTEATCSLLLHVVKVIVYGKASLLTTTGASVGLLIGAGLIGGSNLGSRFVNRVPGRVFAWLVEATMIVAGLRFLVG